MYTYIELTSPSEGGGAKESRPNDIAPTSPVRVYVCVCGCVCNTTPTPHACMCV